MVKRMIIHVMNETEKMYGSGASLVTSVVGAVRGTFSYGNDEKSHNNFAGEGQTGADVLSLSPLSLSPSLKIMEDCTHSSYRTLCRRSNVLPLHLQS